MLEEEYLCFYDQNFISTYGLSSSNIVDYFSSSQFYNRQCVNEILKMQSQFANIDISDKLTSTIGFYYILEHQADNLFVIAKKEFDGYTTIVLKVYYCMFGYIYCAPTLKSISDARTIDCLSHLNDALDKYEQKKKFSWLRGLEFKDKREDNEKNKEDTKLMFEIFHEFCIKNKL